MGITAGGGGGGGWFMKKNDKSTVILRECRFFGQNIGMRASCFFREWTIFDKNGYEKIGFFGENSEKRSFLLIFLAKKIV